MKKEVNKVSGKKLAVRILAIILSVLMVVGIAYYTIYMMIDAGKKKIAEEQEQTTEEKKENNGGSNTDDDANLPDDAADDIF